MTRLPAADTTFSLLLFRAATVATAVALLSCGNNHDVQGIDLPTLPTASFSNERIDFGNVIEGEILNHSFALPNATDGPLVVTAIDSDCGCSVSVPVLKLPSGSEARYALGAQIPAGATLSIDVAFDTIRKRGPSTATLSVSIQGFDTPLLFALAANVTPHIEIQPLPLDLGLFTTTQAQSGEILITSPSCGRFRVSLSKAELPSELDAVLSPVTSNDEFSTAWKLSVTLGPDAPRFDNHFYKLPLDCSWPPDCALDKSLVARMPQNVVASVIASVSGALAARPAYLSFGTLVGGQVTTKTLELIAPEASSLEMEASDMMVVECEGISAEEVRLVLTRRSATAFELAATVLPQASHSNAFRGKIRIDGHEELELVFFGRYE